MGALAGGLACTIIESVMRQIATALVFLLSLFWSGAPAGADQNDTRLDDLFVKLQGSSNFDQSRRLEISIWQIWTASSDDAVSTLMYEGSAAMTRRDLTRSLRYFDQVVIIAPEFAEGWNKRATVNYLLDRYDASLEDIAKTLELEPRHFGALAGRGLVLMQLDRQEEALQSFEEALKIHPRLIGAHLNAEALRKLLKNQQI